MALNTRIGPTALAAALGLAALAGAGSAKAVSCASVIAAKSLTNVIYGSGGSAITPTLAKVALVLSTANPPVTVFYQDAGGAQVGYDTFKAGTGGTTARPYKYWLKTEDLTTTPTCTFTDAGDVGGPVDFATIGGTLLGLFPTETLAADTGTFLGPTQGVNVIVPKLSTQTSISTQALFFVYGFGSDLSYLTGAGATSPIVWNDKGYIFQRAKTSFVQQYIRGAIRTLGGTAANFPEDFAYASTQTIVHSVSTKDDNQGTVDSLVWAAGQGKTENAIGFTSGPTADKNRGSVHTLAYQHTGQTSAYWPDSTPEKFDKLNIRNGHYFLWDTNQFFAKISGSNANPKLDQITNANVRRFIGLFSGQVPDKAVNQAVVETGSIPLCAMHVARSGDFTGLSCYAPAEPCDCAFEKYATGATTCGTCDTDADCGGESPACHLGYCEAY